MSRYAEAVARGRARHGDRYREPEAADRFAYWMDSGDRIKVRVYGDEEVTGTVSITTGWHPAFILMRTSRSIGSSILLDERAEVVGVKKGRDYVTWPIAYSLPLTEADPDKLRGPALGARVRYIGTGRRHGTTGEVIARSYLWAPDSAAYHGTTRGIIRYDDSVVRFDDGGRLVINDHDLEEVQA